MAKKKDYLTATDFYRYIQCPHWPYYERFATREEKKLKRLLSDFEIKIMEDGVAHEKAIMRDLFKDRSAVEVKFTGDPEKDFKATLKLMQQGAPLIYQGTLTHAGWTGRPDLLERRAGKSVFGAWHYAPVDIKSSHDLQPYQKYQLAFYAALLKKIQKFLPVEPAIINLDGERIRFNAAEFMSEFEEALAALEKICAGEKPEPVLRKACHDAGPWGALCERSAEKNNDIALLYNVDVKKLRVLRSLGICTVEQAAEIDPTVLDGAAPGLRLHGLEVIKTQAQALLQRAVFIRKPVELPETKLEIHFDIESDLPNDFDYLYGFLIRHPTPRLPTSLKLRRTSRVAGDRYKAFVAEKLEDEGKMWYEFMDWLGSLPEDYVVYHFAPYEKTRLKVLEKRYGGGSALERFREKMIDLKTLTSKSVVFPLYFYGLKYVARFLGFDWVGKVTKGGQSIEVFEKYLETGKRTLLDSILKYNEEDVRATAVLKDWLAKYAKAKAGYQKPYPWE
jgi:uncharacterized protein